ncbi:hypothetical protein AL504_09670 [Achromobacter xylosoxidans]|uniref:Uncharacterized protein n=1 Tax=Alcaligenes xylosoxydans xylosoxydans TaxID=85698 RepID=A0A0X8NXR9_ALCXX|nr:hypothetical protein AL504_09670 [Achromobacter xylosoxidans]
MTLNLGSGERYDFVALIRRDELEVIRRYSRQRPIARGAIRVLPADALWIWVQQLPWLHIAGACQLRQVVYLECNLSPACTVDGRAADT